MNFVTKFRTRQKGAGKRGRPRKHASPAARQAAYKARKAAATPVQVGTRVQHKQWGTGIVVIVSGDRARVAFPVPERTWRDIPISELIPLGITKKIPVWADWDVKNTKKRTLQFHDIKDKNFDLGRMEGEVFVRKYRRKVAGRSRRMKDYSALIDANLVFYLHQAKRKK